LNSYLNPLPVTISNYTYKPKGGQGNNPSLLPANSSAALELYNSGSNNPNQGPIVTRNQYDQARHSSHHFQSPSGSTITTNTPSGSSITKMNGGLVGSPMNISSPGYSTPSGIMMNGTPTYNTDSIQGDYQQLTEGAPCNQLKKYLEPYTQEELRKLLLEVSKDNSVVCQALLDEIKRDKKWCKLFVHGLSFQTSKETLQKEYSQYGSVKEAVVLVDKKGASKGYGFVTFENAEQALLAAKEPKKRIDSRMTHCNLAFKGNPKKFAAIGGSQTGLSPKQRENANDRRLFVHSLAWKTTDQTLYQAFQEHGELQEAVVIRDKKTNKSKGYGFVTYKYSESARAALREPNKKIDGRQTHCNFACERGGDGGAVVTSPSGGGMGMGNDPMNINAPSNGMGMGLMNGHSNTPCLMGGGSNTPCLMGGSGQPGLTSQYSNPLSLPMPGRSNSTGSMHTPNQLGGAGSMTSPNRNGMNGLNSFTSPSYGLGQGPYGQGPAYSQPPPSQQFGMGSGPPYPSDPTSLIRPMGSNRPNSPLNLSGIRGVGNAVGIPTLLPGTGNSQAPGGGSYPSGPPSSMMLGGQSQHNPHSSIVVSGMNNHLFPTPMPPQVPSSPNFSRKAFNNQPSPHHQGIPANLGMPKFNTGVSDISMISSLNSMPLTGALTMPMGGSSMSFTSPTRKIMATAPPSTTTNPVMVPSVNGGMNAMGPSQPPSANNGNTTKGGPTSSGGLASKQMSPVKIAATTAGPPQNEGNDTPKSQASDDEGDGKN